MKSVSISGSLRENVGKKDAKAQRKQGLIPCVIYGGKEELHFVVEETQFRNLIFTPEVKYAELDINGKHFTAIIQDSQWHPITDKLLHVDFLEIVEGKPINSAIPVLTVGTSPGVLRGGKLVKKARKLKVKGELKYIPENVSVDISSLDINDSIRVQDVKIDNVMLMDNPASVIVSVVSTRNVEDAAAEE